MDEARECHLKTRTISGKKVSKPLMEKKRRARINNCLDQLKVLLENYYTNNVRKRKLEKADILEMTVKHLRNLQSSQQGSTLDAEYQAGFRGCLAGVNRYLQVTDSANRELRFSMLALLSSNVQGAIQGSSTADSSRVAVGAIRREDCRSTKEGQDSNMAFNTACHLKRGHDQQYTCVNTPSASKKSEITQEHVKPTNGNQDGANIILKPWDPINRCLSERQNNIKHTMVGSEDLWRPW